MLCPGVKSKVRLISLVERNLISGSTIITGRRISLGMFAFPLLRHEVDGIFRNWVLVVFILCNVCNYSKRNLTPNKR